MSALPHDELQKYLNMTDAELMAEIQKSYRQLVKKFHPDAHPPERREWANEIMAKINRVYERVTR